MHYLPIAAAALIFLSAIVIALYLARRLSRKLPEGEHGVWAFASLVHAIVFCTVFLWVSVWELVKFASWLLAP